jgi:glutamate-ammonia-ligase adenylyltransferase
MPKVLIDRLQPVPKPVDGEQASRAWRELAIDVPDKARPVLDLIFGSSPYLRDLILRDPGFLLNALDSAPEDLSAALCQEAKQSWREPDTGTRLRHLKSRFALLTALADMGGVWTPEQVSQALTEFADAAVSAALNAKLAAAAASGKFLLQNSDDPSQGCGYVVLAMGKQGAFELNYSSDIDVIVLYDPDTAPLASGVEPSTFFVRLTKDLVHLLQNVDEHGYVFRVDLRLRPDPRATQVAIAIEAASTYYENMGQNWERAVMIKARPCAGDLPLGDEFVSRLRPYIWRKYLDFAAIADVQSLKRQIHAVKGHGEITVLGHNLKLGRGGIREIEFFVQTQQLIAGGRNPSLRGRRTTGMLDALAAAKWITPAAAAELKSAYGFLRMVEHRLQMIGDEQTHTLPKDEEGLAKLAAFAGFAGAPGFSAELLRIFETVQGHYAKLFEDAPELGTESGSLVFTGGEDDPETLETLNRMGFRDASEVSATIRGWHFGRFPATRSAKSREILTELMPELLKALARTGDAGNAFIAFDRFLTSLSAGIQIFSLIKANPRLLDLIATILGTAPRLAEQLGRRPKVLDAVLDPAFFGPLPEKTELEAALNLMVPEGLDLDETADRVRIFGREQMFRVGVRVLSDTVSAADAGFAFSSLAEVLIERLHQAVTGAMERQYGKLPGGRSAVIAMGKLGSREMTAGSDLDLILVYDVSPDAEMSDGKRPLSVPQYYSKLTQRLVTAISAPTAEGVLYEVDMRLRPSGSQGPVAASLASFKIYQRESAWTWERLALTRARPVAGDAGLWAELELAISAALQMPRDMNKARQDVLDMRKLMFKEFGACPVWDIKRHPGGLVDVEFIAQYLQLVAAAKSPGLLNQNTLAALDNLDQADLLEKTHFHTLKAAGLLYHRLTQILRLCVDGPYDPEKSPTGLNRAVAAAAEVPDIARVQHVLTATQNAVFDIFSCLIGSYLEPHDEAAGQGE